MLALIGNYKEKIREQKEARDDSSHLAWEVYFAP